MLDGELFTLHDETDWNLLLCKLHDSVQFACTQGSPLPHPQIGLESNFTTQGVDISTPAAQKLEHLVPDGAETKPPDCEMVPSELNSNTMLGYNNVRIDEIPESSNGMKGLYDYSSDRQTDAIGRGPTELEPRRASVFGRVLEYVSQAPWSKEVRKEDHPTTDMSESRMVDEGRVPVEKQLMNLHEGDSFELANDDQYFDNMLIPEHHNDIQEPKSFEIQLSQSDLHHPKTANIEDFGTGLETPQDRQDDVVYVTSDDEHENIESEFSPDPRMRDASTCTPEPSVIMGKERKEDPKDDESENIRDKIASVVSRAQIISKTLNKMAEKNTTTGNDIWGKCCKLLRHPTSLRGEDEGKQLLGSRRRLSPEHMMLIYRVVEGIATRSQHGMLIANEQKMGGYLVNLGVALYHRLSFLNVRHFDQHPELHAQPDKEPHSECRAGHPFGIECVCIPNSLTKKFIDNVTEGPILLVVPPAMMSLWEVELQSYIVPSITLGGVSICVARPLSIDFNSQLRPILLNVQSTKTPKVTDLRADVTMSGTLTKKDAQELQRDESCDVRALKSIRVKILAKKERDQTKFFLLISTSALISPSMERVFSLEVQMKQKGEHTTVACKLKWAITPSYCGLAEYEMIRPSQREAVLQSIANLGGASVAREPLTPRMTCLFMSNNSWLEDCNAIMKGPMKLICPPSSLDITIGALNEHIRKSKELQMHRKVYLLCPDVEEQMADELALRVEEFSESLAALLFKWIAVLKPEDGPLQTSPGEGRLVQTIVGFSDLKTSNDRREAIAAMRKEVRSYWIEASKQKTSFPKFIGTVAFEKLCAIELLPSLVDILTRQDTPVGQVQLESAVQEKTRVPALPKFSMEQVNKFDCPQLRQLDRIILEAGNSRRSATLSNASSRTSGPFHVVVFIQWYPHLTMGVIAAWISTRLSSTADVVCIHPDLRSHQKNAVANELEMMARDPQRTRSIIVLTNHELDGVQWGKLAFANYCVQWGSFPHWVPKEKILARIAQHRQRKPVHEIRIHADKRNSAEGAVRSLYEGRYDLYSQNPLRCDEPGSQD